MVVVVVVVVVVRKPFQDMSHSVILRTGSIWQHHVVIVLEDIWVIHALSHHALRGKKGVHVVECGLYRTSEADQQIRMTRLET